MNRANIVLTGLPRSGTTLTVRLLNKLPNTVALHEPISPGKFARPGDEDAIVGDLEQFFRSMRRMILTRGTAISKNVGGEITDNAYEQTRTGVGVRVHAAEKGKEKGEVAIRKRIDEDFLLAIKQPAMFSALLPTLVKRFRCFAIVRNPLSVLASWNSVDHNVRDGHAPGAERYDGALRTELAATRDRAERQLRLLSWWYGQFDRTLPEDHILRYEQIVASGGKTLSVLAPAARALDEPLRSQNMSDLYERESMRELGERLLASEGHYWRLYARETVQEIIDRLE